MLLTTEVHVVRCAQDVHSPSVTTESYTLMPQLEITRQIGFPPETSHYVMTQTKPNKQ